MPAKTIHPEYQYLNLLKEIMKDGTDKPIFGVEGVTLRSLFGRQIRFDLSKGFPLLTTKKVFTRGVIEELLWFLRGDSNVKYLVDRDVHIWDEWAYKPYKKAMDKKTVPELSQDEFIKKIKNDSKYAKKWGELGPVYGVQWRKWPASDGRKIDQLAWAIDKLKRTPERKSIVVSAWNPEYLYEMALPGKSMVIAPCHMMYQFNVNDDKLSMNMYIRSQDSFLGAPFNFASYALLLMMVAQVTGLGVGDYVHTFGDVHIYSNHFDAVREQLKREPKPFPTVKINPKIKDIDDFRYEDFKVVGYDPHPTLKAPITLVGGF